jgi:hypothetical protein
MTCRALSTGTSVKRLTTSKLTRRLKVYRFQQLYEVAWILNEGEEEDSLFYGETSQGIVMGTSRTHCRFKGNVRLVNLEKPYRHGGLLWYGVNLCFRYVGRAVFSSERSLYIFFSVLAVGSSGRVLAKCSAYHCIWIHSTPPCNELPLSAWRSLKDFRGFNSFFSCQAWKI